MKTMQEIQEKIFKTQDKIRMAEMMIAHAKAELDTLQESIFDQQELEWLEKMAR